MPPFLLNLLPLLFGIGGASVPGVLAKFLGKEALAKGIPGFLGQVAGFGGGEIVGEKLLGREGPGFFQRLPELGLSFAGGIGTGALAGKMFPNMGRLGHFGAQVPGFIGGSMAAHALGIAPDPQDVIPEPDSSLADNNAQMALLEQFRQLDPSTDNMEEFQDLLFRLQATDLMGPGQNPNFFV